VVFALENELKYHLYNIGSGTDLAIKSLAELIQRIVGHLGEIYWDSTKPDGTPRKLMDVSKMYNEGWTAKINLDDGITATYQWFLENQNSYKEVKL
jgi:GDP-L-fucose synthase